MGPGSAVLARETMGLSVSMTPGIYRLGDSIHVERPVRFDTNGACGHVAGCSWLINRSNCSDQWSSRKDLQICLQASEHERCCYLATRWCWIGGIGSVIVCGRYQRR